MRKLTAFLSGVVLVFGVVGISNATLIDRGGGLIYDTDLDITWLQDAPRTIYNASAWHWTYWPCRMGQKEV